MIVLFNGHPAMKQAETGGKQTSSEALQEHVHCNARHSRVKKFRGQLVRRIPSREVHKCVSSMHLLRMRRHFSRLIPLSFPFFSALWGKGEVVWISVTREDNFSCNTTALKIVTTQLKKKEQEGKKLLTSSLACDPHFSFPSLFAETKPLTNQSHTHTQWCWGAERALFFDIPSADCAAVPRGKGHTRQTTTTLPNGSLGLTNRTKTALVCVRFLKKKSAYKFR